MTRMLAPLRPIMYLWIQFGASTVAVWTLCAFSYTMLRATNSQTHNNKSLHLPWQIPVVWFYWQSKLLPTRSNNERAHLCSGGMTQAHLHLMLVQYQRLWQAGEAYNIVTDTWKELGIFFTRWHPIVFITWYIKKNTQSAQISFKTKTIFVFTIYYTFQPKTSSGKNYIIYKK